MRLDAPRARSLHEGHPSPEDERESQEREAGHAHAGGQTDGKAGGQDVPGQEPRPSARDEHHAGRHGESGREGDVLRVVEGVAVEGRGQGQQQDGSETAGRPRQHPAHAEDGGEGGEGEEHVDHVARLEGVEWQRAGRALGRELEGAPVHRDVLVGDRLPIRAPARVPAEQPAGVAVLHALVARHPIVADGGQHHGRQREQQRRREEAPSNARAAGHGRRGFYPAAC